MEKHCFSFLLLVLTLLQVHPQDSSNFPQHRGEAVIQVMKKYVGLGLPGLAVAVYTAPTGYWSHAEGFANVEKKIPMTTAHVHYLQSISKTYMAVAILKLYESGELDLDDPVKKYIDYPWLKGIEGSDKITLRMLLNHTSGLPEYSTDPGLVSRIIQDPLTVLSVPEMLSYIEGKQLESIPGSNYVYRNTNYELLSLVADAVTGDHVAYINREILVKLGLDATFYLTRENYTTDMNLVSSYWDVLMEGLPADISKMQRANVASMKGDDGIVAAPADAVRFLKGLVEGQLLKPETMELMKMWVNDADGNPRYGLGLAYYDLDLTYAIGHSGGGIGAGCILLYLPELQAYAFVATNFNTMMESPIRKKSENIQLEILQALFME